MITLSMIVKNEEKYLEACLKSVKDVVDEIILVDTGSTDNTIEIAKKYSAKIFHFEWINDFAAARNFALEQSTCDWILYLDADECLSKESISEIIKLTKYPKRHAYYCIINNIDEINFHTMVMTYPRLFPNEKHVRFEGKIHEQIEPSLLKNNFKIKNSTLKIDHYGYNISEEDLQKKAKRNLEILLEEYAESSSSYFAFQIGQSYGTLKEKENAKKYFTYALQDTKLAKEYKSIAYRYLAANNMVHQNYPMALELINKSLQCDNEQPMALVVGSQINMELGDMDIAGKYCRKAFEENRKYLKGEKTSNQNILVDELQLCNFGLKIALLSKNKELFNFFYKEYPLLYKTSNVGEVDLYNQLLNNQPISYEKLAVYAGIVTSANIELILTLFDYYKDPFVKLEMLQLIKERFQEHAGFHNKLGLLLIETEKYSEAKTVLEWGVKNDPQNQVAINSLAKVNQLLGFSANDNSLIQQKSAEEQVLDLYAQTYSLYEGKLFYESLTVLSELEKFINVSVEEINYDTMISIINLSGHNYLALGEIDKAREAFERALSLNPSSSSACAGLGETFLSQEKYSEAKTMFEWAVQNDEKNELALQKLININKILGLDENDFSLNEGT
ncbi:MAG: hypothetical protein COW71_04745 [Ignavibacteriales bacterium CG18_big_fil_WC_8_21_14_2_50_31_20]|nr:MAG: hypothetical protein COW71_04745 [Ignavibacteriales bacterium CG18_big_fil_WC_8_21_14_2_50_31_20]